MKMSDFPKDIKAGQEAESRFKTLMESKGWTVTEADRMDNIRLHIDFYISKGITEFSVDVKSVKSENHLWVQLKNVQGKAGWLYGQAYYIVFAMFDRFYFVKREDLIRFVEKRFIRKRIPFGEPEIPYRLYKRRGRKDEMTKLLKSDIVWLAEKYEQ